LIEIADYFMKKELKCLVVSSRQISDIEKKLFDAGMPVAALMEKAAILTANRIKHLYPNAKKVSVLVGPGHNGGDGLVIARELHLAFYQVSIYLFSKENAKELTRQHLQYAEYLTIPICESIEEILEAELIIDGFLGYGLTREISGELHELINRVNISGIPVLSIDIPSGINSDTGATMGIAIAAERTFCLGMWKLAHFQDQAIVNLGEIELIDIGITDIAFENNQQPTRTILSYCLAQKYLPLPRHRLAHKYQQGHLLLICGSSRYGGSAILSGLGARAGGVGMLSIAVPSSLKSLLVGQLPEALVIGCSETTSGAIAEIEGLDLSQYDAIVCGPGLTIEAHHLIPKILESSLPVILDADALNSLALLNLIPSLPYRNSPTILTPHLGEFKRLFPQIKDPEQDRFTSVSLASQLSGSMILFKGARTLVSNPDGQIWCVAQSTPALARGGSGDVLAGLIGALVAQSFSKDLSAVVATAAWWHAQAALMAEQERTELGVDPLTLSKYLAKVLSPLVI